MTTTVINLTDDGFIDPAILVRCRNNLTWASKGLPLIVVSQTEQVDLPNARNIVCGPMQRCWLSLYKQMVIGLEAAETDIVAIAERDMLYTPPHFAFCPPTSTHSYHNENMWMVQWVTPLGSHPEYNGMYSFKANRLSWASMIADRKWLLQYMTECLAEIMSSKKAMRFAQLPDRAVHLRKHIPIHTNKYRNSARTFTTAIPIIDIRHDHNFSGQRRGTKRRYTLHGWGQWEPVWYGQEADC